MRISDWSSDVCSSDLSRPHRRRRRLRDPMSEVAALPVVSASLIDQLRAIVGEAGLVTGSDVAARYPGYFMDRIGDEAIVRPRTTEQVAAILRLCTEVGQEGVVPETRREDGREKGG